MVIYKVTNRITGEVYIGQTVRRVYERLNEHVNKQTALGRAILEYSLENFDVSIIDKAETIEELNEKEKTWIDYYMEKGPSYNVRPGGGNKIGYHHTDETKQKLSVAHRGKHEGENNPFYGKHHSKEQREKWSEQRRGRKLTDEWKRNVSLSLCNRRKVKNVETGEIFNSIREAAEKYGVPPTHITRVCRGKRKRTGGYHWEYVEDQSTP